MLQFSDGSCFFVSEADLRGEDISALELVPDLELSELVIQRLKDTAMRRQAREKALDLLARAPHTTFSLRMKLLKRDFDARLVEEVLEFLTNREYLDDRSYADNWLRTRCEQRPEGRTLLLAGLLRKGVGREIAEAAVNRYLTPGMEQENAVRALEKLTRSGETDPVRLMKKLKARGFPFPLIRRLVEERRET
ncbi:MAG: regulatory protein RecX [Spirochaetaceae bacterium]|nr:MAG: regulatory protein RecX [Spirochaetaceae bacterium]